AAFRHFQQNFDLTEFNLDPLQIQKFELVLSGSSDPTVYLDNLQLAGLPEPAALLLCSAAGILPVLRRRRHI
ncbi:MAG TPA: hypothetical protein VF669_07830, partial [Tepidisphaeraceae bacterium]